MKTLRPLFTLAPIALISAGFLLGGSNSQAAQQTDTWLGTGSTWQTSTNWGGAAVTPAATTVLEFNAPSYANMPTTGSSAAAGGAIYVTTGVNQAIAINGTGTLTLAGNLTAANAVFGVSNTAIYMNDSANNNLTISAPITLSNSTSFNNQESGGTLAIQTGALSLTTKTLTLNGVSGSNINISSSITGTTGAITDASAGTVTLSSSSNSLTGVLTISGGGTLNATTASINGSNTTNGITFSGSGGTLQAASGMTIAKSVLLTSGGTFDINQNSSTISGNITGAGALTVADTGGSATTSLTLSGSGNTFSGGLNLNAGKVIDANSNSGVLGAGIVTMADSTTIDLGDNSPTVKGLVTSGTGSGVSITNATGGTTASTLTLSSAGTSTFAGVIGNGTNSGGLGLTLTAGSQTLSGANTYTGATTINGGTLQLGVGGTTGSLSTSSTISDSGTFSINRSNAVAQGTDFTSTAISGTGGLTQAGSGTTTLSTANTFSGGTTISAGALVLNNVNAVQNSIVTISAGTGTTGTNNGLQFSSGLGGAFTVGGLSGASNEALLDTGGNAVTLTVGNNNSTGMIYSGALSGTGGLTMTGSGTQTLSGANTYTGATTINSGTLQLGAAGTTGTLSTSSSISGSTGGVFLINRTNAVAQGTDFSGSPITGGVGVTQAGSGTTTLNAVNTYTGNTTITGGALTIGGSGQLGGGTYAGTIAISSGKTFNYNSSATQTISQAITGAGSVAEASTSGTLNLNGTNTFSGQLTLSSGTLVLNGSVSNATQINPSGGTLDLNNTTSANAGLGTGTISQIGATINNTSGQLLTIGNAISEGLFTPTFAGSSMTFTGGYTVSANVGKVLINNLSSGQTLTFSTNAFNLSAASTRNVNYSLGGTGNTTISAAIQDYSSGLSATGSDFDVTNSGITTISGANAFGGSSSGTAGSFIVNATGGTVIYSGSNTGSIANTTLTAGTLQLANNNTDAGLGSGTLNLNGGTLQNTYGGTITLPNAVSLGGNSIISGSNSITLSGSVNQSATTSRTLTNNLSGSTLTLSGPNINLEFTSGAAQTLTLAGTGNTNISSTIADFNGTTVATGGAFTITNTGTTTLSAANIYSGLTTVNAGTLALGINNAIKSGNAVTVSPTGASAALDLAGHNETIGGAGLTLGGSTSTSAASVLNSTGTSTLTLSGGATAVNYLNTNNPLGATISVTKVDLNAATQTFTVGQSSNSSGADLTISSVILDGSLTKAGAGTLVLSGANSYTGATSVTAGTLNLASTGSLSGSNISTSSTGAFTEVAGGTIGGTSTTFTQGSSGTSKLAGTNSYTGATTVNTGTLNLVNEVSLYNNSHASWTASNIIVASGATLDLNVGGTGQFTSSDVGLLTALGTGSSGFESGSILGLDTTNATGPYTVSANIGNPNGGTNVLALIKLGTGTLVLSGTNTYTGTTTVAAGTLQDGVTNGIKSGNNLTLTTGGIYDLNGYAQTLGVLNNGTGATVTNSGSSQTLTIGSGSVGAGAFTGALNLVLNAGTSTAISLSGSVNNSGTITNSGTGSGTSTLSGGVGANVTGITQNSTISALTISGTPLTVNSSVGTTLTASSALAAGNKILTVSAGVTGTGNLILDNNTSVNNAVTLTTNAVNNTGAITSNGSGSGTTTITGGVGSNVTGIEESGVSPLTISTNAVSINTSGSTTLTDDDNSGVFTVSGGVTGSGNLILNNNSNVNSNGAGTLPSSQLVVTNVSNSGSITNSGSGAAVTQISGTIASSVTALNQASSSSPLLVSGTSSSFTGPTTVSAGTLLVTGNIGSSAVAVNSGGTLSGAGGTVGNVTLASGGAIDFTQNYTTPPASGTPTLTVGNLTLNGGVLTFQISGVTTTQVDNIAAGTLTINGLTTITIANYQGLSQSPLTPGLYSLITYTNGTLPANLSDLSLTNTGHGAANSGMYYTLVTSNLGVIQLNVASAAGATNGQYTLTTTAGSTNLHVSGTTTLSTVISNTGTSPQDSLTYSAVTATATSGTVGTATGTTGGSGLAVGTNNSPGGSQTYTAPSTAGNVTIGNSATVSNISASGTPVATNTGTTIKVWRYAAANTVTTPVNLGNVHVGGTFGTATLLVQNTAANDGFSEKLDASVGGNTGSASSSGSFTTLAAGSTNNSSLTVGLGGSTNTGTAGSKTGTVGLTLTSDGSGTSGLGTTPLTGQTLTVNGGVYAYAATSVPATVNLGNIRVGGSFSSSALALSNTGTGGASFTEGLDAAAGTTTGNATGSGSFSDLRVGAGSNSSISVGLTGTGSAGAKTGTVSVGLTSNGAIDGLASTALTAQGVTVNGGVYAYAQPSYSTSTIAFGSLHVGATAPSTNLSITNSSVAPAGYQDSLNATPASTNGNVSTGSGFTSLAAGSSQNVSVTASTSTAGSLAGTVNLNLVSNHNGVSGLSDSTLGGSVSTSGTVYSGLSTWTTGTSGSWGTISGTTPDSAFTGNWDQGAPGVTAGFTGVDTATFGAHTSTPITVSLDAAAPNLNSITFSSPTTGYTLAQGTGSNSITLSGTTPSINVTGNATAGTQTINTPIVLGANTSVNVGANQKLNFNGVISDPGESLTYTGPGATVVTAANTYTGGTSVTGGTLYVNNTTGSGTGTGAVTVSGGALAGEGIISTGAGVGINGGGKLASGDPSQVSGTALSTTGGLTVYNTPLTVGSGTGTANLTFDLASGNTGINGGTPAPRDFSNPNNNTTYLSLTGSSSINFAGTTSISLVDLTNTTGSNGSLALRIGTPYLLIHAGSNADYLNLVINSGTDANPIYSLSQNDALVNGYVLGVWAGGSNPLTDFTPISIAQYGANGMTLLTPGANGVYPAPALYLDAGNLEVVPEPGTWALMIGGLALLVVIQRRRNV